MYMSALGWDEGVAEFVRREKPGYDDVKRIFGQTPSCYGQPGSSWGPQAYGAMRQWKMPMYLDYGKHVGLDGKPHFFGGALTVYNHTDTLRSNLGGEKDVKVAQDKFVEVHKKLIAEGGGLVSIYYHPCEFVHNQFWDGANFNKGANPPREKWQKPLAKTAEESKIAYDSFYDYIRFIKRFAEVKFITASEAVELYQDKSHLKSYTSETIQAIAGEAVKSLDFQVHKDYALTPSEILYMLNAAVAGKVGKALTLVPTPFGPSNAPRAMADVVTTEASQLERTAADVHDFMEKHGRVPSTIWLGSSAVTPEAYFAALAQVVASGKGLPEKIELRPAKLVTAKYVSDDNPKLWGWTIFPPNFLAPELMELAKRQAWTIKPAIRHR
jgi:hypothetical protein